MKESDFKDTLGSLRGRLDQRQKANYKLAKDYFDYKHLVGRTK